MANCTSLFGVYHGEICIPSTKKQRMITSKGKLRERIRKYFKENHPAYVPKFFIQGSAKMKNGIRTKDDICDLDDGIYFFRQPKAMIDWFNGKKDKNGQLVRITMFLKGWCDNRRHRMPNGLAMTILASNAKQKFYYNDRDDITLRDTLKEIKKALDIHFSCVVPVTPKDDLFADYDEARKRNFLDALREFIDDADTALKETNELKASRLWRKHLGDRFPLGDDKEESSARNKTLAAGAATSYPFAM